MPELVPYPTLTTSQNPTTHETHALYRAPLKERRGGNSTTSLVSSTIQLGKILILLGRYEVASSLNRGPPSCQDLFLGSEVVTGIPATGLFFSPIMAVQCVKPNP